MWVLGENDQIQRAQERWLKRCKMWIISPVISEMPIFPLSKDSVIQVLIRWVLTEVAGVCGGVDLPKEYQTFSVGSQQPQVRHFYGLAWSEPVCLRAALQSTMDPLSVSSRLKCCLYHLPVKTNTAGWRSSALPWPVPAHTQLLLFSLGLHWDRGCSTNTSSETRAPGICFRDTTSSSPSHFAAWAENYNSAHKQLWLL